MWLPVSRMQLREPGAGTCLVPSATSVLSVAAGCAVVVETSAVVCATAMPPTPKAAASMVARINSFMAGSEVVLPRPLMAIVLLGCKAGAGPASATTAFVHDGSEDGRSGRLELHLPSYAARISEPPCE